MIEPDRFREICYDIAREWMRETLRGDPSEAISEFVRQLSSFDKRLGTKLRDMRDSEGVPSDEDMLELAGNWSMAGDDAEREEVVTEIKDYLLSLSGSGEPPEVLIEYTRDDLRDMGITKGTLYENAPWLLVRLPPAELRAEGVAMKHCVGDRSMGYVKAVADGDIEIWSLRRASDMKPRFTLEVDGSIDRVEDYTRRGRLVRQVKGKANRTPGFAERRSTQVTMPDEVVFWDKAFNQMNIDPYEVDDMKPGLAQAYMVAEPGLSANSRVRRRSFDEPYRRS